MKVIQRHLFNQDESNKRASISWSGDFGNWWFVHHKNDDHRVLHADEQGRFYYAVRDFPRVVPVVWNLRSEAARAAKHHNGRVKQYPYRLK